MFAIQEISPKRIRKRILKMSPAKRVGAILLAMLVILLSAWMVRAAIVPKIGDGAGRNQLSSRLAYRLDLHTGQGAGNESGPFRLYEDAACTQVAPAYRYRGSQAWAVIWPETNNGYSTIVTIPIINVDSTGEDDGYHYTTYYGKNSDLQYIISGTGHFNGADWNESAWWNQLPSSITYTSIHPGNVEKIYVGNNVGGFQVSGPNPNGYFTLRTGKYASIMSGYLTQYTHYDTYSTDATNAVYQWNETEQAWSTAGLYQGQNTVSYAGMDWSGNYLTGNRTLLWDTVAPLLSDTINRTTHNGWINKNIADSDNYTVSGRDDISQTNDVSGIHGSSLQFSYDGGGYGGYNYSSDPGGVTGTTTFTDTLSDLVAKVGQGTHSVGYSMFDIAGNYGHGSTTVKIDTVAPSITAHPVTGQFNSTKDGVAVDLTYSDATSGMDTSTEYYQWVQEGSSPTDSGWQTYIGQPVTQTQKGVWDLYFKASDKAGNSTSSHTGPYYCGSLSGYIQSPGTEYVIGEDVIASVIVHSDDSGDITSANGASVTLVAKDGNGNVLTNQTKDLVVPNNSDQLIWYRFHINTDSLGPIKLTATINSDLADAQHNPFYLDVNESLGGGATFYDYQDEKIPDWVNTDMAAPVSTNTSASWQEWSYSGGAFQHNTYTASASASLKIKADPDSPTAKTDPVTGHVTQKSGYGIVENPSVTVKTDSVLGAVTGAQNVLARYPEWNYQFDHANLMEQLSSSTDTANKTITSAFTLPENLFIANGYFSNIIDKITQKDVHFTPGKFYERKSDYIALVTATDIWTPAGRIEASATDNVTFDGFLVNEWAAEPTNKQMLGY